jgi:hypothetical protein
MSGVLGIELDILSPLGPLGDDANSRPEKRAFAGRKADLYRVIDPEQNAGARSRMRVRLYARVECKCARVPAEVRAHICAWTGRRHGGVW